MLSVSRHSLVGKVTLSTDWKTVDWFSRYLGHFVWICFRDPPNPRPFPVSIVGGASSWPFSLIGHRAWNEIHLNPPTCPYFVWSVTNIALPLLKPVDRTKWNSQFAEEHKFLRSRRQADPFYAGFLFCLFFDLEDGGEKFRRNVGSLLTDHTVLHPRRWNFSRPLLWKPQILHSGSYLIRSFSRSPYWNIFIVGWIKSTS